MINIEIKSLRSSSNYKLQLVNHIKGHEKEKDGVIGCDEQGTTITPPIGLDLEAVNIYCLLHDKMIYKMKNIDKY